MKRRQFIKRASGLFVPAAFNLWLPKAHAQLVPPVGALRQHETAPIGTAPDAPTASWRFNTGALTTDSVGSETLTNVNSTGEATGKLNACADFNGTDQYFSKASNANLQMGANGFGICGWFWFDSFASVDIMISKRFQGDGDAIPDDDEFRIQYTTNTFNVYAIDSGEAGGTASQGTAVIETWYFVAATWDVANDLIKISVNGAAWSTGATNGTPKQAANPFRIGGHDDGNGISYFTDGRIDAVAWWNNTVLTQDNVTYLYNGGIGREL